MSKETAREYFEKGCNEYLRLFCEKHEFDYEDAKEMWDASRKYGKMLFPCQAMRWRNYMQHSKSLVETGELGDIYFSDL